MELFGIIAQVLIAWVYGHLAEYAIHRWLLHGVGRKRGHPLSFHFAGHHGMARTHAMYDEMYEGWPKLKEPSGKELMWLSIVVVLHTPLLPWFPWAYATLLGSAVAYYYLHRKSHINAEWARHALTWHYDHHMGIKQDANYGVRSPMFDHLFGTRVLYYGTRRERADHHRRLMKYKMRKLHEIRSRSVKRRGYR